MINLQTTAGKVSQDLPKSVLSLNHISSLLDHMTNKKN